MRLTKGWMWVLVFALMTASVVGCGCGDDDDDSGAPADDDTTDDDSDDDATDDDSDDDSDDDADDDVDDDADDDADDDVEPQCVDNDGDTRGTDCDAGPDCDDADENNWLSCATCLDNDGDLVFAGCDGYTSIDGPDCNDGDASVWQFLTGYVDADGDYFFGTATQVCSGDSLPGGYADEGNDCDDQNPDVNPDGFDIPDDGIDQDCDDGDFIASDSNGFFVDEANGDDGDAGTKAAPFATIQKGVDEAAAVDGGENVYVAGGTYDESLTTTEASLFGGYDPADWTRDLVNNPTTINGQTTFAIYAIPTQPLTIDGFEVNMPDSVVTSSMGIMVSGGEIRISNNIVGGGDDSGKNFGIYAFLNTDATVVDNQVTTGTNLTNSAYGVFAYAFNVEVRNNVVSTVESANVSVGIYAMGLDSRIWGNDIDVGDPATTGYGLYAVGATPGATFDIRGNTVLGAASASAISYGCYGGFGTYNFFDNDIEAGDSVGLAMGLYLQIAFGLTAEGNIFSGGESDSTYGSYTTTIGDTFFANNVVEAGEALTDSIGLFSVSIDGESVIANNTILASSGGSGYSVGAFLYPYQDLHAAPMTVINNTITVGAASGDTYGVYFSNDGTGAPLTFVGNNITSSTAPDCLFLQADAAECLTVPADINDCSWTDCAAAEGNLNVNPQFVNAGAGDYDLTAGSALVDAGVNPFAYMPPGLADPLNWDVMNRPRPRGAGWDIGAYEYQP